MQRNVANLQISYELDTWSKYLNTDFTLGNCLFGAVKLTKMLILINIDIVVIILYLTFVHIFRCQMVIGFKKVIIIGADIS